MWIGSHQNQTGRRTVSKGCADLWQVPIPLRVRAQSAAQGVLEAWIERLNVSPAWTRMFFAATTTIEVGFRRFLSGFPTDLFPAGLYGWLP